MRKPNFLIIGAQKAGTTTLHAMLDLHPQVFMSPKKEINYFFREDYYKKGEVYYQSFFQNCPENALMVGEASPGYCVSRSALQRIAQFDPGMRLIFILREPIARGVSQYWHNRRKLSETLTFEEVIAQHLVEDYGSSSRGYFSRGVYYKQIDQILEYFPKQQVLILLFEEMHLDPRSFYAKVCDFLGIDFLEELFGKELKKNNAIYYDNPIFKYFFDNPGRTVWLPKVLKGRIMHFGKKVPFQYEKPGPAAMAKLSAFYAPLNAELEERLGYPLVLWQKK